MRVINGDCREVMASMEENSVDAIVCDPPYGIGFMNAGWDSYGANQGNDTVEQRKAKARDYADDNKGAPRYGNSHGHAPDRSKNVAFQQAMTPVFEEMLRVAKPGAYLLAFSAPRTYHRLACAIEDADWRPVNTIAWMYGSGFPKGLNVSKSFARAGNDDLADAWYGWNTQLKPAWEPILMAQKPFDGTVTNNIKTWGVGALNIDGCRVPYKSDDDMSAAKPQGRATSKVGALAGHTQNDRERTEFEVSQSCKGRFPANLIHDGSDEVLACFPDSRGQQGDLTGNEPSRPADGVCYGEFNGRHAFAKRGDSGSAARFFYCAKASKSDRNRGGVENDHISVKPNALMRWLVRLVCPEGGVVLDPFAGSGSTGVACADDGMDFIGIEMDAHYCEIAEARIASVTRQLTLF